MSQTMTIKDYANHRNVSKNMVYKYIEGGLISRDNIIMKRPRQIDVEGADSDLRRNAITRADYPEDFSDDYDEDDGDDGGDMVLDLGDVRLDVEESPGKSIIRPLLALILWQFSQIAERRGRFKGLAEYVVAGKWLDPLLSNPDVKRHMEWISRQIDKKGYRR